MDTVKSLHSATQQFLIAPSPRQVSQVETGNSSICKCSLSQYPSLYRLGLFRQNLHSRCRHSPKYPNLSRNHHRIFKRCSYTLTARVITGEINENVTSVLFNFTSLCKALDSAASMTYFIYCLFLFFFFSRKSFIKDKSTWLTVTRALCKISVIKQKEAHSLIHQIKQTHKELRGFRGLS